MEFAPQKRENESYFSEAMQDITASPTVSRDVSSNAGAEGPSSPEERLSGDQAASAKMPPAAAFAAAAEVRERWRAVLAKSNREMLRELAQQSMDTDRTPSPNPTGSSRSVDRIAQDVADRILAEVPDLLAGMQIGVAQSSEAKANGNLEAEKPKLADLSAVPWNIWVGGADAGRSDRDRNGIPNGVPPPPSPPEGHFNPRCAFNQPSSSSREPAPSGMPSGEQRSLEARRNKSKNGGMTTMTAGLRMLSATYKHTWMTWQRRPETVLLVAKPGDANVMLKFRDIAIWLDSQGATVLVEPELLLEIRNIPYDPKDAKPSRDSLKLCWCQSPCSCPRLERKTSWENEPRPRNKWGFGSPEGLPLGFAERCRTWTPGVDELERYVDLVVCLGGDGTLCFAAGLFRGAMPPVVAFAGGSLGFLTPFPMSEWMSALVPLVGANLRDQAMQPVQLACRTRFQVRLIRAGADDMSGAAEEETDGERSAIDSPQALNEVLVHRGSSGHLVKLDVLVNKKPITMVQGDGLILATPTGSTAYSLAAGGSMVHPSVLGIILTPVCPHSLSFRPVVLPDSATVTVKVPRSARSSRATVAVDGKDRIELCRGDSIEVSVSAFPLPTICRTSETDDWFDSVNEALKWNLRREQKSLSQA